MRFCWQILSEWARQDAEDKWDKAAAIGFFMKAMRTNSDPGKFTIDKRKSDKTAVDGINPDRDVPIEVCQNKCFNNIIEQNHRTVKWITKSRNGINSFRAANNVLVLS